MVFDSVTNWWDKIMRESAQAIQNAPLNSTAGTSGAFSFGDGLLLQSVSSSSPLLSSPLFFSFLLTTAAINKPTFVGGGGALAQSAAQEATKSARTWIAVFEEERTDDEIKEIVAKHMCPDVVWMLQDTGKAMQGLSAVYEHIKFIRSRAKLKIDVTGVLTDCSVIRGRR